MKAKIIMLETTNNKDRKYPCVLKYSHLFGGPGKLGYYTCNIRTATIQYHFYLIDESAEIKIGDYYTNGKNIFKCDSIITVNKKRYTYLSKIIASTDSLRIYGEPIINGTKTFKGLILQLSNESIKLLIDYYNKYSKMPDEVEVEYENYWEDYKGRITTDESKKVYRQYGIKLNSEGTVDITIPEEKMYSREEVIELCMNAYNRGWDDQEDGYSHDIFNWIQENIK